jgi:hypothetical protein
LGVGRKISPLVAVAIMVVATALFGDDTIVFVASFYWRKQEWVKMSLDAGRIRLKGIFASFLRGTKTGRIFSFYHVEAS